MAKKKSRPKGPYSNWMKTEKADPEWSLAIRKRDMKCVICGKAGTYAANSGLHIKNLHAHHIIGRGRLRFRYDLRNGITLCAGCHNFSDTISAHGPCEATLAYFEWLKESKYWEFFSKNKDDKRFVRVNFEDEYERLKELNK